MVRKDDFWSQVQFFQIFGFIFKNLGYFLFIGFFVILYIGNVYLVECNVCKIQEL